MIIKCLDKQFSRYGVPSTLRMDNRANLVSAEMDEYMAQMGIKHRLTTPLWPRANGEVQRLNRSLLKEIRVAHAEKRNWRSELNKFLLAYRSTLHVTTGKSPAELLYGRKMTTKMPKITDLEESEPGIMMEKKNRLWLIMSTRGTRHQAAEKCVQEGDVVLLEGRKRINCHHNMRGTICGDGTLWVSSPVKVTLRCGIQAKRSACQVIHDSSYLAGGTEPCRSCINTASANVWTRVHAQP